MNIQLWILTGMVATMLTLLAALALFMRMDRGLPWHRQLHKWWPELLVALTAVIILAVTLWMAVHIGH